MDRRRSRHPRSTSQTAFGIIFYEISKIPRTDRTVRAVRTGGPGAADCYGHSHDYECGWYHEWRDDRGEWSHSDFHQHGHAAQYADPDGDKYHDRNFQF